MELLDCIFRRNPIYEIEHRYMQKDYPIPQTSAVTEFYLRHRGDKKDRPTISLTLTEAQIIYTLEGQQELTSSCVRLLGNDLHYTIIGMVYDNIIQVQNKGIFEGGPTCSFVKEVLHSFPTFSAPNHLISKLSWDSIHYANYFSHLSQNEIVQKLYSYNAFPRTRFYDHFNDWFGTEDNIRLCNQIRKSYTSNSSNPPVYWFSWYHNVHGISNDLSYKLYISPKPNDVRHVFSIVANICCTMLVPAFKIGANLHGIIRPDKLVLYFSNYDALERVALRLREVLQGIEVQGVPYTNPFDTNGLLSWAIEPVQTSFEPATTLSWRMHVASCIGRYLKLAYVQNLDFNILNILARIRLQGIDSNDWNILLY